MTPLQHRAIVTVLVGYLVEACAVVPRQPPPSLDGTYTGATAKGQQATVTLSQDDSTVQGTGQIGDRAFSLSALVSWHGPAVLAFGDGSTEEADLLLSVDGDALTVLSSGESLELSRGPEAGAAPGGEFTGRFRARAPMAVELSMSQSADLVAGAGFVEGRPVGIVGRISAPRQAAITLLFPDESRADVQASLSDGGETMTVDAPGGPLELTRR